MYIGTYVHTNVHNSLLNPITPGSLFSPRKANQVDPKEGYHLPSKTLTADSTACRPQQYRERMTSQPIGSTLFTVVGKHP